MKSADLFKVTDLGRLVDLGQVGDLGQETDVLQETDLVCVTPRDQSCSDNIRVGTGGKTIHDLSLF